MTLFYQRVYKYTKKKLKIIKKQLNKILVLNKIKFNKSLYISPIIIIKKFYSKKLRPYINYYQLSFIIIKNNYSILLFNTILKCIRDAKKYIKLNILVIFNYLYIKSG